MIETVALVLTLVWIGFMIWFFVMIPAGQARLSAADPLGLMMTILGVGLPVALIWVAASAARTARVMREESSRLEAAIDAMRASYLESREAGSARLDRSLLQGPDVTRAQPDLQAEMAVLRRPQTEPLTLKTTPPAEPEAEDEENVPQTAFALDVAPDPNALPAEDFIRALNFPDNERDQDGFRVLRAALDHHPTAQLVTASQDLLTLLAQDGIYMDDLAVQQADPVIWRAFAGGTRGPDVAALGGVRDRSSLALTTGRLNDDSVFRDAAQHFLQTFDRVFALFAAEASDAEILRFADTRTARAFMVTARAAGLFDQAPTTAQRVNP
ncbi:hypothetical protein JSE7799_02475 [Jannaschia seosinensis]|uniref:Uncharacterized protein n=1 Tax=Jannaschia seosinensis TaxID=313367 RepID=A0A0M7BAD0_9RHOB|nr:hypothetical protein [Jannaschia seosinensis]CUH39747.1 hypothetical protein JSE7799_02475 [Jannaschia seosinensis]